MAMAPIMTPATGVYLEAAKPLKGLLGSVHMSNDLIFDDKIYKFVGIFPSILGKNLKRFLIVKEQGEVVKDKDLSWKCLRIYELFMGTQRSERILGSLSQDGMDYLDELKPFIPKIHQSLKPHINEKVDMRFEEFNAFFEQVANTNVLMHEIAIKVLPKYQMYKNNSPIYVNDDFKSFESEYLKFNQMNCERSILVMDSVMCRGVVKLTLNDKKNQAYLKEDEKEITRKILEFLVGCDYAEKDIAKNIPSFKNFEQASNYLREISSDFTVKNTNESFSKWVY
ncbi:hypothetical protein KUV80_09760 [Fictibacillus nanhaiensis]|uniref:hypothetical protein n=1 Tax=Fictibacillus nanhaiensis TaxID=742169 RepID=UPI001C96D35B|nr:hypothetical protein [Fictibacillus nanhaiensis]MBY6036941.1 hypothetical protein [Fictibacillus nanhaiensis]